MNDTKISPVELASSLNQFTGTTEYHKFSVISKLVITDGVKYLCDSAGCYWLMDIIASYQPKCNKDEMLRDFQLWILKCKDSKWKVGCYRDTDDEAFNQPIEHTDFPLPEIKLYCINGVILLTSEY